jgi:predicted ester cyclase
MEGTRDMTNTSERPQTNDPFGGRTPDELIRLIVKAFESDDMMEIEPLVADHFVDHSEMGGVDFRQRVEMVKKLLADARMEAEEVLTDADGGTVAWRWTVTGRHVGKMLGIQPTDREVRLSGLSLDRFEDGKVVEHWEFPDIAGFLEQFS